MAKTQFALLLTLVNVLTAFAADGCGPNEKLVTDEYGDQLCRSEVVKIRCLGGDHHRFYDERVGRERCCPPGDNLHISNAHTKAGVCCPKGEILNNGKCEKPRGPAPPPEPLVPPPQCHCTPRVCAGPCTLTPVCGDEKYNGLDYGSCYVLTFPDGKQLGRRRDDWHYEKDGYIQDIPFKVCKAATDCSKHGPVGTYEPFYLEDQLGGLRDPKGEKGWLNNAYNGNHLSMTSNPNLAGQLKGKSSCANGECAIQLYGGPDGGGLAYACPVEKPGVTFWANKKIGVKIQFAEVPCDGDWPAFRAANVLDRH